ncbi:ATP-dependent DNA helicase RecQ [Lentilactobacillus sp. Marseille-Q4993]|uniref:RecQ family ATP-dependent DNA helicase n=1 Tax=Lentilactobacillus sp. Marseille-Q4993 TaxID=3039492 RepID=UPI0024BC23D3|nr:ATP-dependent DNA helicase RecQ [Lentilactobacillus sp. Marseille-Q4993]
MKRDIDLNSILKTKFGFNSFRPGQREVLNSLISGRDTLAVLPTGGGKTLLYQMYGYVSNKSVLVVSPLISLMNDQVRRMNFLGAKRVVALTSSLDYRERQAVLTNLRHYDFIFSSPEMLANPEVLDSVKKCQIGLMVIDEAHCISEWGPDFRPDYLNLAKVRTDLNKPLTLMLTATANRDTRLDILNKMNLVPDDSKVIVGSIDRPNIFMAAKKFPNDSEKNEALLDLLSKLTGSGVIYFSSRKRAEQIAEFIKSKTGLRVLAYHGGLDDESRFRIQQQFMHNECDIVCATSAFGMGIDKADIRFVIHYHIPANIQSYAQEIGRCGRDGKQSVAITLYQDNDRFIQLGLLDSTVPPDAELSAIIDNVDSVQSDISSVIKFYLNRGQSKQTIRNIFKDRRNKRFVELDEMLGLVMTTNCRRQLMLDYFGEQKDSISVCCDNDTEFWKNPGLFIDDNLPQPVENSQASSLSSWRDILNQLFLEKN